jgi:hypothetical protein
VYSSTYLQSVASAVHKTLKIDASTEYYAFPIVPLSRIYLDVAFSNSPQSANTVDMSVTVFDSTEKTATYSERALPLPPAYESVVGSHRPLSTNRFYGNVASMLLHRNFWIYLLAEKIQQPSDAPLVSFLSKALH